jgi:primosomal protein N' (replication factor Y) (superfamily II helicase)
VTYAAVFPLVRSRAFAKPFDYLLPDELREQVCPGSLVAVPLGPQSVLGVVVDVRETTMHEGRVLALGGVVDLPRIPSNLLRLAERVHAYFLASTAASLALVAPPLAAVKLEKLHGLTAAGEEVLRGGQTELAELRSPRVVRARASLARWRRRGWVRPVYRLHVTQTEKPSRLLVCGESPPTRAGARQRAALELLARRGALDERALRHASGLSAVGLTHLIQSGAVAVCDERAPRPDPACPKPRKAGTAPYLLPAQEEALAAILAALGSGGEVLLHGVTGSGKTEVYLQAAQAVLARGESVLVLVPEIGLTGQTVARVGERFSGERVAVLHSGLSAGERLAAYCAVAEGRARLVIGARSAIFAPMVDLGLIVVDEEHDASYKQETEPRYDARTVARWRAAETGAALVLGSATPSVESFARVPVHTDLTARVDGSQPPPLEVIDMRDVQSVLSPALGEALTRTVEAGQKAILFLNRRGYASSLVCGHCGRSWHCPHCDVTLSQIRGGKSMRCRICGHGEPAPAVCDVCGSVDVRRYGVGTERLEREVATLLPGVELLRLDSDIAASFARLQAVLAQFAAPGAKVLVGTQMIAKGHHFPEVTLVGVVDADLSLHFPDFRAEERTYDMLVQVGGRSGRGLQPGRVIVQTLDPQARPIALAAAGETERFYHEEIARREALGYPPASTLVSIEVSSMEPEKARKGAAFVAERLARACTAGEQIIGPGPLSRERGRFMARTVVKSIAIGETLKGVSAVTAKYAPRFQERSVRIVVDVEPQWL